MSAISTILTRLRAAIWAIDVRDDIANAIEQCYSDVSNPTLQTEALEAALQEKIDQGEMAALTIGDHTITAVKLANGVIPAADATLTETGKPADAAETGRQIGLIKADLDSLDESLDAMKLISNPMAVDALLACFRNVAWINNQGQECYDNLVKATNGLNPVYEITGGTDISTSPINTGISVFGKNEDFTILAKLRLKVWPTERAMGLLVNDRYVSNGTLRLGTEYENGLLRFVTNVMYGDLTTGYVIPANVSHDIKWVVRVKDKIATKILYIDNQQYVNKVEDISSYMDAKTFEGNYYVSGINSNSNQNTYPAVIELFRIYDCALDNSYIASVMDINV